MATVNGCNSKIVSILLIVNNGIFSIMVVRFWYKNGLGFYKYNIITL